MVKVLRLLRFLIFMSVVYVLVWLVFTNISVVNVVICDLFFTSISSVKVLTELNDFDNMFTLKVFVRIIPRGKSIVNEVVCFFLANISTVNSFLGTWYFAMRSTLNCLPLITTISSVNVFV